MVGSTGEGSSVRLVIEDIKDIWIEYDRQNDILYINFGSEEADESVLIDDDIVVGIKDGRLVGITIYSFSRRAGLE